MNRNGRFFCAFQVLVHTVIAQNKTRNPPIRLKFGSNNLKSEYQRINYFKNQLFRENEFFTDPVRESFLRTQYRNTQTYLSRNGEPPFYATVFAFPNGIDGNSSKTPDYFEKAYYTGLKRKLWCVFTLVEMGYPQMKHDDTIS